MLSLKFEACQCRGTRQVQHVLFCKAGARIAASFVSAAIFTIRSRVMLIIRSRTVACLMAIVEGRVDNHTVHTCRGAVINK